MKNYFKILLIAFWSLLNLNRIYSQNIIFKGGDNWESILKQSKVENKIIFVDAQTTWCVPCKEMEKLVFTDSLVYNFYNEKFINVKMDMEKGDGKILAKKYNVQYFPTYLFIDSNGNILHRNYSKMSINDFLNLGKNASNPYPFEQPHPHSFSHFLPTDAATAPQ